MVRNIRKEQEALIKQAQQQPGIGELMIVYGHYDDLVRQSNRYLMEFLPKSTISTSNKSSC
jgi:hypothetical protein